MLAYTGKANITSVGFDKSEVSNEELNKLQEITEFKFTKANVTKVNLDFDNDGEEESVYTVNSEEDVKLMFSVLIYRDGNKYYLVDKISSKDNTLVGFSYLNYVVDIFEDGKLELIYTTAYFDDIGSCNVVYRLKGKKYVKVNECEIVR